MLSEFKAKDICQIKCGFEKFEPKKVISQNINNDCLRVVR